MSSWENPSYPVPKLGIFARDTVTSWESNVVFQNGTVLTPPPPPALINGVNPSLPASGFCHKQSLWGPVTIKCPDERDALN